MEPLHTVGLDELERLINLDHKNIIKCFCLFPGTCQTGPKGEKGDRGPPGIPAESRKSDFRLNI